MKKEDFFYLGRINKAIGSGERFRASLDTDEPDKYKDLDVVFLNINHTYIPFFIKEMELNGTSAIIEFEEDTTEGIEELLTGCKMYLPGEALPELKGNKFYYHEVKGFTVIDSKMGKLGVIEEVLDLQKQALFKVRRESGK
ncbi:MAG: 16S rRNA processing protein RimM [Bacteroidota bacterium]|nr:16S rRNA processing protein RimM [Bacteroidota bacterium]